MSQFINKKENVVTDAVDATVAASNGKLARLDGYPHIRVVVRNDWDKFNRKKLHWRSFEFWPCC